MTRDLWPVNISVSGDWELGLPRFLPTLWEWLFVLEGTTCRCMVVALWAHPNPSACLSVRSHVFFQAVLDPLLLSSMYQTAKYLCCLCLLCVRLRKGVVRLCFPLGVEKDWENEVQRLQTCLRSCARRVSGRAEISRPLRVVFKDALSLQAAPA